MGVSGVFASIREQQNEIKDYIQGIYISNI